MQQEKERLRRGKKDKILTGHVNSNGNLIGFIDGPFCGWFLVAVGGNCVKLNVLSPRICVAAAPNVHDDVVSISAWYCFKHIRKRVLQPPWHEPLVCCFSLQHRPRLFTPSSLRKDFSLNSNNPEHEICEREKNELEMNRNGILYCFEFNFHQKLYVTQEESRDWIEW